MLAAIRGDETLARVLLDAGADVDAETPTIAGAQNHPGAYPNPETQHWTALTYCALQGQLNIAKLLLERGANVEGGARLSEDKCTETPLQVRIARFSFASKGHLNIPFVCKGGCWLRESRHDLAVAGPWSKAFSFDPYAGYVMLFEFRPERLL